MSTTFQKIPADEFARRHGWRKSAVVHRIRAGIYDGVKEGGTWYVLRDAPPGHRGEVVAQKTEPGFEFTPPELPWATVPGPILWAPRLPLVAALAFIVPLLLGRVEDFFALIALAITVTGASLLYEGVRTGVMPNRGFYMAYSRNPIQYTVLGVSYLGFTIIGLLLLSVALLGWPRARGYASL